jgi:hypothetical protein
LAVSKQELEDIAKKYSGDNAAHALAGMNLTLPQYISGNRGVMFTGHLEQFVPIKDPESPNVFTAYELPYGKYTDSYKKADYNYYVVDVISKFATSPRFNYVYIVKNIITGVYDVIPVNHCENMSESHGYLRPYTEGDMYTPGSIIPQGSTIFRSNNHDEHGNYRYGYNANCAYISIPETEEDGIVFRKSFADSVKFYNVEKVDILLNINDILLNIYGDSNQYKCFPNIGEEIKNGMLAVKRKMNYNSAASELTEIALQHIVNNDEAYYGTGVVTDIDVWINNRDEFNNAGNRQQILFYYYALKKYYEQINSVLGKIVNDKSNKYTAKLRWLFEQSRNYLDQNIKWTTNANNFEFALITITLHKEINLLQGYKTTDRYGGKGVICNIWEDDKMPVDEYGTMADVILSPPGIIARANPGQLYEHEINFISERIKDRIIKKPDLQSKILLLTSYVRDVSPREGI